MLGGANFFKNARHLAAPIYQKSRAQDTFVIALHDFLGPPNSIEVADFVTDVGQQRKWQLIFFLEFYVRFHGIRADPEDGHVGFFVGGIIVAKAASLFDATRR